MYSSGELERAVSSMKKVIQHLQVENEVLRKKAAKRHLNGTIEEEEEKEKEKLRVR